MKKLYLLVFAFILGFYSLGYGQSGNSASQTVYLRSGRYIPAYNDAKSDPSDVGYYVSGSKKQYGYVQFTTSLNNSDIANLKAEGVELIDYIPDNTYYIGVKSLKKAATLSGFAENGAAKFFNLPTEFKIDPVIISGNIPLYASPELGFVFVTVITAPDAAADALKFFNKNEVEVLSQDEDGVQFSVKISDFKVAELAENAWVRYIELAAPPKELKNKPSKVSHRVFPLRSNLDMNLSLDGEGIIVGEWDGGQIGVHEDLNGRINAHSTQPVDFHSTHVAGTILGKGLLDPKMEGMAPEATLWSSDYQQEISAIAQEMTTAYAEGVRVTNNSWGYVIDPLFCEYHFPYLSSVREFDKNTRENPYLLHVFANGNDQDVCPGGFHTALWNMKNALFVGAVDRTDKMSDFSSFGPTYDGRLVPHVSSVGVDVYSTVGVDSYYSLDGTSMAAPGVAGTLALLQQQFKQENDDQYPSAALLKAIVCNTARDKGNIGPDYKYGFGIIDGLKSAQTIANKYYLEDNISTDEEKSYTITLPANLAQLRVLLTYTDTEGSVMAQQAIVSKLNISVAANGETYLPWKLDPQNPDEPATKGNAAWDNIKQVTIDNPVGGNYTIKVQGVNVPMGTQSFAVTYWFEEKEPTIVFPYDGVVLSPGEVERLTWSSAPGSGDYAAEISIDNGQSWSSIGSGQLSDGGVDFTVPEAATANAFIRLLVDGEQILSKKFSILQTPANLKGVTGYKEITLTWDLVENASSYDVFKIENAELVFMANVTTNQYLFEDLEVNKKVFMTVRSRMDSESVLGERAKAISAASIPLYDLGVVAMHSPVSGCHLTSSESLRVAVKNFGEYTYSAGDKIPVAYTLNNGGVNRDTIILTEALPRNATVNFTFKKKAYMSIPKAYSFKVWTALQADNIITTNDTLIRRVENYNPISTFPYRQNFDDMPDLQGQIINGVFDPVYLSAGWDNDHENDDFEWWPNALETLIDGTGPSADHTSGEGKYLYTESSFLEGQVGELYLLSPCFDLAAIAQPTMYFWYHAFSESLEMGSLHLDAYVYGTQEWMLDIMPAIVGSQGDKWKLQIVDLMDFRYLGSVKFRFRVVTSTTEHNAFAIDDFKISDRYTNDLATISLSPAAGEGILTADETINIELVNYGRAALAEATSIPVGFSINDTLTVHENFVLPYEFNFADTIAVSFNQRVNLEGLDKRFSVDAWVAMPSDGDRLNDSIVGHKVQTYTEVWSKCFAGVSPTGIGNFYFDGIHESQSIRNYGTICGETGTDGYSLVSNQRSVVYKGYDYDMGVQAIIVPDFWTWPSFGQFIKVWIDFNRDGYLSDDEIVYENDSRSLLFEETTIHIPVDAELGPTRLRVRSSYHANEIMVPDAANSVIRFGETEDYIIEIKEYPKVDLEVLSLTTPPSQVGMGNQEKIYVNLRTLGSDPLVMGTQLPFQISINGAESQEAIAATTQLYENGDQFSIELPTDFDFSEVGSYRISVINAFEADTDPVNDTTFAVITNMKKVSAADYSEDFENGVQGWWDGSALPEAVWEHGKPNKPNLNAAYSGDNVWITKLTGEYPAETEAILFSPVFDFTSITSPYLTIMLNIKTEEAFDGMILEASVDGETWAKVNGGDALYNYKTTQQSWDLGAPWWSGYSAGWKQFGVSLVDYVGESDVMFRFRFRTDIYVNDEGIAIDNFTIAESKPNVKIKNLITPVATGSTLTDAEKVSFTIENIGNTVIPSKEKIVIGKTFNGETTRHNHTLNKPIRTGEQYLVTIPQTVDMSAGGVHLITVFVEMDGDVDTSDNSKEFSVQSVTSDVDYLNENELTVYPNPGKGLFNVTLPSGHSSLSWKVFAVTGNLLTQGSFNGLSTDQINLTHLAPGTYLLQVYGNSFNQTIKLIVY